MCVCVYVGRGEIEDYVKQKDSVPFDWCDFPAKIAKPNLVDKPGLRAAFSVFTSIFQANEKLLNGDNNSKRQNTY